MNKEKLKQTWDNYFASKAAGVADCSLQNKLVEHYVGLLKIAGAKMHPKHNHFSKDELSSMGTFGLYDAVANFDPLRKVKFETYAMPRIRGAILDEIRKGDWVPRLVRSNSSKLDKVRTRLESEAGHKLTDGEMAEKMGISREEFQDVIKGAATPAMHMIHDLKHEEEHNKVDYIVDESVVSPGEKILRKELFDKLLGKHFVPLERKIIWLYYVEETPMKEISGILNISESRVSQIHANVLERLRRNAKNNPKYFSDIWDFVSEFKETVIV